MVEKKIVQIDSVDTYNKLYGWETLHPLVTVVNHTVELPTSMNHTRLNYGLYALFLKQGEGCSIRYGREKYDYQEGTVVSFKPGQVVEVEWDESKPMPPSRGLLFHPDLIYGTPLAKRIHDYTFFDYDQREALHLSEREQYIVSDLLDSIEEELQHPVDKHSQTLITDAIGLLLDYCMRYYDRQFITRHKVNSDIMSTFEHQLSEYFRNGEAERKGLPTVAYFADKACLSPGYFGDLVKKETGLTAQRYIQIKVIDFRTDFEKNGKENRVLSGADYICLPLQPVDDKDRPEEITKNKSFNISKLIMIAAFNDKAKTIAKEMYPMMVKRPACQRQFAAFLREVINTPEGAIYFHCTQGKDRTGLAAAYLLSALGVDRDTIIADFDKTNQVYARDVRKFSRRVKFFGGKEEELSVVRSFTGANTDNFIRALDLIDAEYGSMDTYLRNILGLTNADFEILKGRYLTSTID